MKKDLFALKGTICYSKNQKELIFAENSYAVCENGLCAGVFSQLPEEYKDIPVKDMGDRLIIPGFTDLHLHAPQYAYRGTGMDLELLDWLNTITFPQEAKYADLSYAKKAYSIFVDDLQHSFTTRACIFATLHRPATELLMDMLDEIRKTYDLSILMTTHDFSMLERYADRVVLLREKILCKGTPLEVLNTDEFAQAFHLGGAK